MRTIPIGSIVGVFGLRGRVKVLSSTDFPERFELGETVLVRGKEHTITWSAWHKTQVRLGLSGIKTIEVAQEYIGAEIEIPEDSRPELDDDEFYAPDLIGMVVKTSQGRELGRVTAVINGPAQDLLEVGEILIPLVEHFVHMVDFDTDTITVELIPGMLPEDSDSE